VKPLATIVPLFLGAGVVAGATAAVVVLTWRRRLSPAMRERRRRLDVNARGHMADATVIDIRGDELYYSYMVRRIEYNTAQDISAVRDRLPADPWVLIGPATVKYSPRNPANSIVVCEEWSGLRDNRPQPQKPVNGERSVP
jgi:hypothetical protein